MREPWPVSGTTASKHISASYRCTLSRFAARVLSRYSRGRVLGVYRRSVNVLFGPYVITLADASAGGLPQGVSISGLPEAWDALGLRSGGLLALHGAYLSFEGTDIVLHFSSADLWIPPWENRPLEPSGEPVSHRAVARFAGALAPQDGMAGLLRAWDDFCAFDPPPAGLPSAARLGWEILREYLVSADSGALWRLLGLGPGLTPSGDDLLRGYIAFRTLLGRSPEWMPWLLKDVANRTNPLSRQLIWHAVRRRVSERLGNAVVALGRGGDWQIAVAQALQEGHSSGADALVGMLLALLEDEITGRR